MRSLNPEIHTHEQLLDLYQALLGQEARYEEFKELLALYPTEPARSHALEWAAVVGERVNARLRQWIGEHFQPLSAADLRLWRSIVVEERFNASEPDAETADVMNGEGHGEPVRVEMSR